VLSPCCRPDPNELMGPTATEPPGSLFVFCDVPSVVGFADSLSTCVVDLFWFAKKFVGAFDCCAWFPKILLVDVDGLFAKKLELVPG
jgi:hypothetical protein